MRNLLTSALLVALIPATTHAQGNPFRAKLKGLPTYTVEYSYGGDMTGTGKSSSGDDRFASAETRTGKFFGKQTTTSTWSMTDADFIWSADLEKKTGMKSVNPLPSMAKAYDDLDRDGKARFTANMKEMMQFVTRAFPGMPFDGEKKGTRTYAGESCDLTEMGAFSFCTMKSAPIVLYSAGSFMCVNFEQTATSVRRSSDASLFQVPADVKWTENLDRARADSGARAFIGQFASQAMTDSIAKAKSEMAAKSGNAGSGQQQMTPEQQKQMCDALKNFSISTAFNNAMKNALNQAKNDAINGAVEGAANKVRRGLGGLIKRP
ncbi:MAG: hypothetical protein ABIZ70_14590 [Gemmatimonadales bacterium]